MYKCFLMEKKCRVGRCLAAQERDWPGILSLWARTLLVDIPAYRAPPVTLGSHYQLPEIPGSC